MNISTTGSLQYSQVNFVAARWGAGAQPGRWHVFASTPHSDWSAGIVSMSCEAVIDDFGNLVRVPS